MVFSNRKYYELNTKTLQHRRKQHNANANANTNANQDTTYEQK